MNRQIPKIGVSDKFDDTWDCVSDLLKMSDGEGQATVVSLPSARKLRSLVVINNRPSAARLVMSQFGGGGARRNFRARAVATLIAAGFADKVPGLRSDVPVPRPGLGYLDWLREALPAGTRVGAILLGPPRANRKPVVLLINSRGHLVAVAKFGVNEVTRPLVKHEAQALHQVGHALGDTIHVPRLIASRSIGKGEVVLMRPLPTAAPGRRPSRAELLEVVRAVAAIDPRPGVGLRDLASHPRLAPIHSRIEDIERCNERVERGSFHGDLHPGNLAVARDGRIMLWDWERWGHGAPVGFDLLHHDLQSWITRDRMDPRDAALSLVDQSSKILEPLGVGLAAAPSVARDYLIRLASRYTADRQERAGAVLGAIERWLFPAVLD